MAKNLMQRAYDTWPDSSEVKTSIKKIGLKVNEGGILVEKLDSLKETNKGLSRFRAVAPLDRAQAEDLEKLTNVEIFALSGDVGHLSLPTIMQARVFPDLVAGNLGGVRAMCET